MEGPVHPRGKGDQHSALRGPPRVRRKDAGRYGTVHVGVRRVCVLERVRRHQRHRRKLPGKHLHLQAVQRSQQRPHPRQADAKGAGHRGQLPPSVTSSSVRPGKPEPSAPSSDDLLGRQHPDRGGRHHRHRRRWQRDAHPRVYRVGKLPPRGERVLLAVEQGGLPWRAAAVLSIRRYPGALHHLASRARPPERLHPVGPVSHGQRGNADSPPRRHAHVQHRVSHAAEREVAPIGLGLPPVQRRGKHRVLRGPAPVPHLQLGMHETIHRSDGHRVCGPLRLRASLRRRRGVPSGPPRMYATGRQLQPVHMGGLRTIHGRDVHLRSQAGCHWIDRAAAQGLLAARALHLRHQQPDD